MWPMPTTINLRNVPPDFVRRLNIAAAIRGISAKQFVLDVVGKQLEEMERAGQVPAEPKTKRPGPLGKQ